MHITTHVFSIIMRPFFRNVRLNRPSLPSDVVRQVCTRWQQEYCDWRHGRRGCGGRQQLAPLTAAETDDSAFLLATPSAPPVYLPGPALSGSWFPAESTLRRSGPGAAFTPPGRTTP